MVKVAYLNIFKKRLFHLTMVLIFSGISNLQSQVSLANWEVIDLTPGLNLNVPNIIAIAYGNNTYAAIGYAGGQKSLFTSLNGIDWIQDTTAVLPVPSAFPDDLVFLDNEFKMSTNGSVYTSEDLSTWTFESSHLVFTARNLKKVNTLYFQGGEGNFATSTDGINWVNPMNNGDYLDLAFGNNTYVLVGRQSAKGILYTSTDGVNWDNVYSTDDDQEMFYSVDFHDDEFILSGNNGVIGKSTDGTNWSFSSPLGTTSLTLFSIRYILNNWIVSAGSSVYYSADGETWTQSTINPDIIGNLKRIESFNGVGYVPGTSGRIIRTSAPLNLTDVLHKNIEVLVYPNPTNKEINFVFNDFDEHSNHARIKILNLQGQILKEEVFDKPTLNINISELATGFYFYQITNKENLINIGKFIKQ